MERGTGSEGASTPSKHAEGQPPFMKNLHMMYNLTSEAPSTAQEKIDKTILPDVFMPAARELRQQAERSQSDPNQFQAPLTPDECDILDTALNKARTAIVEEFPCLGAIVVGHSSFGLQQQMSTTLHIICPDGYKFDVHTSATTQARYVGPASDQVCLYVDTLPTTRVEAAITRCIASLGKAKQKSVKDKKQNKFHRTPGFLALHLRDACVWIKESNTHDKDEKDRTEHADDMEVNCSQDHGGFTDVGQHTGCLRRTTTYALAIAVLKFFLPHAEQQVRQVTQQDLCFDASDFVNRVLAYVDLLCLQECMAVAKQQPSSLLLPNTINRIVELGHICLGRLEELLLQQEGVRPDACPQLDEAISFLNTGLNDTFDEVQQMVNNEWKHYAAPWMLPQQRQTSQLHEALLGLLANFPAQALAEPIPKQETPPSLAALQQRARSNLQIIHLPLRSASLKDKLKNAADHIPKCEQNGSEHSPMSFLLHIHSLFFDLVEAYLSPTCQTSDFDLDLESAKQLRDLSTSHQAYFDKRNDNLSETGGSKSCKFLSMEELDSLNIFVAWSEAALQLCIAHRLFPRLGLRCENGHPKFFMPLDYNQLSHLVLTDKRACDALLTLCSFLRNHGSAGSGTRRRHRTLIFASSDGYSGIHKLADDFVLAYGKDEGLSSTHLAIDDILKTERQNDERKKEEYRADVNQVLEQYETSSRRCRELHARLATAKQKLAVVDSGEEYLSNRWRVANENVRELKDALEGEAAKRDQHNDAVPDPIRLSLPCNAGSAKRMIFFLYMPRIFVWLHAATQHAHSQLNDVKRQARPKNRKVFRNWFNEHRHRGKTPAASPGHVYLQVYHDPKFITSTPSRASNVCDADSQAVPCMYPNRYELTNSIGGFTKDYAELSQRFRPKLSNILQGKKSTDVSGSTSNFSWLLESHSTATDPSRGMKALCGDFTFPDAASSIVPDEVPSIAHAPFIQLGAIRAFHHTQLRELANALRREDLALDHELAQAIFRCTVWHTGNIEPVPHEDAESGHRHIPQGHAGMRFAWKRDFFSGDTRIEVLAALAAAMERLQDSPRELLSIQILAELSAFFADYDADVDHEEGESADAPPAATATARFIVKRCQAWVRDLTQQRAKLERESTPATESERTKLSHQLADFDAQCTVMRQIALLALRGGVLSQDDVCDVCQLTVLIKNGMPKTRSSGAEHSLQQTINILDTKCFSVRCRRLPELLSALACDDSAHVGQPGPLTLALKTVFEAAPSSLEWFKDEHTACFHAVHHKGGANDGEQKTTPTLYSLNLHTGEVLRNGLPPQILPQQFLSRDTYKRVFGERNFSVTALGKDRYKTIAPVDNCHYTFMLDTDDDLQVEEHHCGGNGTAHVPDDPHDLELVHDLGNAVASAPLRLQQLFQPWYCRDRDVVVLRHKSFLDKRLAFIFQRRSCDAPLTEDTAEAARHGSGGSQEPSSSDDNTTTTTTMARSGQTWVCLRVPEAKQRTSLPHLLTDKSLHRFDHLLLSVSDNGPSRQYSAESQRELQAVQRVLSKFEDRRFIHIMKHWSEEGPPRLHFELPRFNLTFALDPASGQLTCDKFRHFVLAHEQQWSTTLRGFKRYIVLAFDQKAANDEAGLVSSSTPSFKLIVPDGQVVTSAEQQADAEPMGVTSTARVQVDDSADAHLSYFEYGLHHTFDTLRCGSVEGRLHLAALYTAASTFHPEPMQKMTGYACALELLRGSFVDRPLELREHDRLVMVFQHSCLAPSIQIVCNLLRQQSQQLLFSHTDVLEAPQRYPHIFTPGDDNQATPTQIPDTPEQNPLFLGTPIVSAYRQQLENNRLDARLELNDRETELVFGPVPPQPKRPPTIIHQLPQHRRSSQPVVASLQFVADCEEELLDMTQRSSEQAGDPKNLHELLESTSATNDEVVKSICDGLETAARRHHQLPDFELRHGPKKIREQAREMLSKIKFEKGKREHRIGGSMNAKPTHGRDARAFRIFLNRRRCTLAIRWTMQDVVRACIGGVGEGTMLLRRLHPFLTAQRIQEIMVSTRQWMALAVLQQRVGRVVSYMDQLLHPDGPSSPSSDEAEGIRQLAVQELRCCRVWNANDHPYWLAFELDGGLQIRPKQYFVAKEMMQGCTDGRILQLNMGEGKTRVIVPMLLLWHNFNPTNHATGRIARAWFLPQLEHAAYLHLHRYLSAGLFRFRLLNIVFHRHVKISKERLEMLDSVLTHAQRTGPVAVVTNPSSALSMELRKLELQHVDSARQQLAKDLAWPGSKGDDSSDTTHSSRHVADDVVDALQQVLQPDRFFNVYDEVDEILHHKFQLIYATGAAVPLPNGKSRVLVVQALLRILHNCKPQSSSDERNTNLAEPDGEKHTGQLTANDEKPQEEDCVESGSEGDEDSGSSVSSFPVSAEEIAKQMQQHRDALFGEHGGKVSTWKTAPEPAAFNTPRVLSGREAQRARTAFQQRLVVKLLDSLTQELTCLAQFNRDCVLNVVTRLDWDWATFDSHPEKLKRDGQTETGGEQAERQVQGTEEEEGTPAQTQELAQPEKAQEILLTLRGFLAEGKLFSALHKRHRVQYGIDPRRPKRVAVPFRANDVPSYRAEYVDIETTILLTHLAFLQRGLSKPELREAFARLLKLPRQQRELYYGRWFELSRKHMNEAARSRLDSQQKLDLSSTQQWELVVKYYSFNMETIFFWLETIVMREDMKQFPQRLTLTPWNIAGAGPEHRYQESLVQCGFSGTNDHDELLPRAMHPLHVTEDFPHSMGGSEKKEEELLLSAQQEVAGTNGKMLELLLQFRKNVHVLSKPTANATDSWKNVLAKARSIGVDAIIDAGALLAGVNNAAVVKHLLEELKADVQTNKHRAVVYHGHPDRGRAGKKTWLLRTVKDEEWLLQASPIRERDALVVFDQNQCRGADLKLRQTAVAALTIHADITKDVLMQAAGRLRQLGRGQTIHIILSGPAAAKVLEHAQLNEVGDICVAHILSWVVCNTAADIRSNVLNWGMQGAQYALQLKLPQIVLQNERLKLTDLYCDKREPQQTREVVLQAARQLLMNGEQTVATVNINEEADPLKSILDECRRLGTRVIGAGGAEQECERELEREREQEQERQVERPKAVIVSEKAWRWPTSVVNTTNANELAASCIGQVGWVHPLQAVCRDQLKPLNPIQWNHADMSIYCTQNYLKPAVQGGVVSDSDSLCELPPCEYMLVYQDPGELILITQFEAEGLLPVYQAQGLWNSSCCAVGQWVPARGPALVCLTDINLKHDGDNDVWFGAPGPKSMNVPGTSGLRIPISTIAALRLLNGDTMFCDKRGNNPNKTHHGLLHALKTTVLPTQEARLAALLIPTMRQLSHHIDKSALENVAEQPL